MSKEISGDEEPDHPSKKERMTQLDSLLRLDRTAKDVSRSQIQAKLRGRLTEVWSERVLVK